MPYIGQRVIKTSIAVFLCLVFYHLRGYDAGTISAKAAISAIICMQPYVNDTRHSRSQPHCRHAARRLLGIFVSAYRADVSGTGNSPHALMAL